MLTLLPGTHEISNDQSFNVNILEITPAFRSGDIKCQHTQFAFLGSGNLVIMSINFHSCSLKMRTGSVEITSCTFSDTILHYSIFIKDAQNVEISLCEFDYNNGAVFYEGNGNITIFGTHFTGNWREGDGGALMIAGAKIVEIYWSEFISNTATTGGALYLFSSAMNIAGTSFTDNRATESGGAIVALRSAVIMDACSFENNSAEVSGGALYLEGNTVSMAYFTGSIFTLNRAGLRGGSICLMNNDENIIIFSGGSSTFNSARYGGFMYLSMSAIRIFQQYTIANNTALSSGGALVALNSIIEFSDTSGNISDNIAHDSGGALYLISSNMILLGANTASVSRNKVVSGTGMGGAIYVLDRHCAQNYGTLLGCLLDIEDRSSNVTHLTFRDNRASFGPVLYGGLLDRCVPARSGEPIGQQIKEFREVSWFDESPLAITSKPMKVCLCVHGSQPDCSVKNLNLTKMRGETVTLTLAGLDQDANPIPAIIKAAYMEISAQVGEGEGRIEISNKCQQIDFHVYAESSPATLVLAPEGPCGDSSLSTITIGITVAPCSTGFEQDKNRCTCDRRLNGYTTNCNINTRSFKRKGSIWFRYDKQYLKVYKNCPLDYCNTSDDSISISNPDSQCAHNRSGVLCGACQHNYSIALGGSRCLQCTSKYTLAWLIVVFAVAGIALVTLLLVCNVTISAGTLNGLIFYSNVVSTSGLTSLRNCSIHPILSVFIAWVNLDLGIETCFYSGMDTYLKTWLQFVFPLYIWLLVVAIIIASYYSSTAMKIFGRNNIAILATLFLLSYSKFLKTIITVLTFTQVLVGRADNVTDQLLPYKVWTYDGNIEYLKGRHIVLFVVAFLFLLVLFLPYTLALIFGQCLRSMSVRRGLRWIHGAPFISILDAYHAPYDSKHRYWTGLMLLTRCVLFLIFATNYKDNALLTDMFTVTLVITAVLAIKTWSTRIYENLYKGTLELSFLLNLAILSITLLYQESKGSSDSVLCNSITTSVSCSFVTFLGILCYHTYLQVRKRRCCASIQQVIYERWQNQTPPAAIGEETAAHDHSSAVDKILTKKISNTKSIELRESLLDN